VAVKPSSSKLDHLKNVFKQNYYFFPTLFFMYNLSSFHNSHVDWQSGIESDEKEDNL
jgi:hypothetical protein